MSGDKSDVLLLDSVSMDDTTNPFEIPVPREPEVQRYLPAWVRTTLIGGGIHALN